MKTLLVYLIAFIIAFGTPLLWLSAYIWSEELGDTGCCIITVSGIVWYLIIVGVAIHGGTIAERRDLKRKGYKKVSEGLFIERWERP